MHCIQFWNRYMDILILIIAANEMTRFSPKFQILVVQMISIGHENNCGLIHEQKVLFQRC